MGAHVQLYKPFQGGKRLVDIVIYILVNGERRRVRFLVCVRESLLVKDA